VVITVVPTVYTLETEPRPSRQRRMSVPGPVAFCTTVSPANSPEVTVPLVTTVYTPPTMFAVELRDIVVLWPVFQVTVGMAEAAPTRLVHDRLVAANVKLLEPEVSDGTVDEMHGAYRLLTVIVTFCGVSVSGGL
jgi:hypothetical protein